MIDDEITYGSKQVARILGVSLNELRYWDRIGVAPATSRTGGGKHRRYTPRDLTRVRVVQALRADGVDLRGKQLERAVVRVMGNLDQS